MSDPLTDSRLPLLVGVTGKLEFSTDDDEDSRLMKILKDQFRRLIAIIDQATPHTPKVLLCGGAAGVDIAAAETVLEHTERHPSDVALPRFPLWSVVIVLPVEETLFRQDFTGSAAPYLPRLDALLANEKRVIRKELRTLRGGHFDDSKLTLSVPLPVTRETLDRHHGDFAHDASRRHMRRQHYEQLGLWLARQSTIFIAAFSEQTEAAATPFKLGGTARAVAFRRTASPDDEAKDTIDRSVELFSPGSFEDPDGGNVFWIDPSASPLFPDSLPARILAPVQSIFDIREDGASPAGVARAIYRMPWRGNKPWRSKIDDDVGRPDYSRHRDRFWFRDNDWSSAFIVARRLDEFNRKLNAVVPQPQVIGHAAFSDDHPIEYLQSFRPSREPLGKLQAAAATRLRSTQRIIAVMVLIAVAANEIYDELAAGQPWLLASYLGALSAIVAIVLLVRKKDWQRTSEDYRGISEIIRVQMAWWGAGIDRMVDRIHLRRVDNDLTQIRDIGGTISMWALLRFRGARGLGIRELNAARAAPLEPETKKSHYEFWIGDQARYFERKSRLQREVTAFVGWAINITFTATFIGLLLLCLAALWGSSISAEDRHNLEYLVAPYSFAISILTAPILALLIGLCLLCLGLVLSGPPSFGWTDDIRHDARFAASKGGDGLRGLGAAIRKISPIGILGLSLPTLVAALILISFQTVVLFFTRLGETLSYVPIRWVMWLGPILLLFGAMLSASFSISAWAQALDKPADKRLKCTVRELSWTGTISSAILLIATLYVAAIAFTITANGALEGASIKEFPKALREWLIVGITLLLATTGVIRWYSERRNHLAQAAHYDDLLRAFRRAEDILREARGEGGDLPVTDELREHLRLLGELALDENEAWLKAHREKRLEPMAAPG